MIIFSVVTTLSCSKLIFHSLMIRVRYKCAATFSTATSFLLISLLIFFHILTNTKFVHVTFTYYHSWYLVFEFTFIITYFDRVSDSWCMHSYLVYQILNIIFSVVRYFYSQPTHVKPTFQMAPRSNAWMPKFHAYRLIHLLLNIVCGLQNIVHCHCCLPPFAAFICLIPHLFFSRALPATGRSLHCQVEHHVRTKCATPTLYAIDNF